MNMNMQYGGLLAFDVNKKNTNCKVSENKFIFLKKKYRLSYFGSILLEKYVNLQKLELDANDKVSEEFFKKILNTKKLKFHEVDEIIMKRINELKTGSFIIIYEGLIILTRKGKNNLNVMIPENKLNNIIYYINKYFFIK